MSDNADTIKNLFEYAIELENAAERLYRRLGDMFADHADVAEFWNHYADEERGHALYLEQARDRMDVESLSMPANDDMLQRVRKCMDKASQIRLDRILNLEDAYQLATELESSETNAVFEFMLSNFSAEDLEKNQEFLRSQLKDHIAKLTTDFPPEYKSRVARQNIKTSIDF